MNDSTVKAVQAKWLENLPPLGLISCWSILTLAMVVFYLPVAGVAYYLRGQEAILAAAVAAGVCWAGAMAALGGTALLGRSGPTAPLYTLACGLVFNCAVPFTVGLAFHRSGGALAQAGVFGLIVIFFQFVLVVETLLALCLIKSPK